MAPFAHMYPFSDYAFHVHLVLDTIVGSGNNAELLPKGSFHLAGEGAVQTTS